MVELKEREKTGPTVSPYLNLLQSDQGRNEQKQTQVQPTDAASATLAAGTAEGSAIHKVATAAAKAYAATETAYKSGEGSTLEAVCVWSERWVDAELEAATTPAQNARRSRQI